MIVLDTDVLTFIQRGSGEVYARLSQRLSAAKNLPVCATIISFEEQMRGWLSYVSRAATPERTIQGYLRLHALLEDFQTRPVLDFDPDALAVYQRLSKAKIRIATMDLRIAAIAIANDALLITRNLKDFRRVPELRAEDWSG